VPPAPALILKIALFASNSPEKRVLNYSASKTEFKESMSDLICAIRSSSLGCKIEISSFNSLNLLSELFQGSVTDFKRLSSFRVLLALSSTWKKPGSEINEFNSSMREVFFATSKITS